MKVQFTIIFDDKPSKLDFANNLLGELADEKRQLDLTRRINSEVRTNLNRVMGKLMDSLNEELAPLNVKWERYHDHHYTNNIYAILKLDKSVRSIGLEVMPKKYKNFEHSKYVTLNGDYAIRYTYLNSPCWSAGIHWYALEEEDSYVDSILTEIRGGVKAHYTAVNKLLR